MAGALESSTSEVRDITKRTNVPIIEVQDDRLPPLKLTSNPSSSQKEKSKESTKDDKLRERSPYKSPYSETEEDQSESERKRQRMVREPLTAMEIKIAADSAWHDFEHTLIYIGRDDYSKDFTWDNDVWCLKWRNIMEGLYPEPTEYAPTPQMDKNGYPKWAKVIPYNSIHLKYEGKIWKKGHEFETLDPVKMWMEDRWTSVRRVYGDDFTQKLFMRCLS